MEQLKPCPFCGGKARIRKTKGTRYFVGCSECGARSIDFDELPWHDTPFIAQGHAIEAWNRRAYEKRDD